MRSSPGRGTQSGLWGRGGKGPLRREITPRKHGGWAWGDSGPYFLNLFLASFLTVLFSHFLSPTAWKCVKTPHFLWNTGWRQLSSLRPPSILLNTASHLAGSADFLCYLLVLPWMGQVLVKQRSCFVSPSGLKLLGGLNLNHCSLQSLHLACPTVTQLCKWGACNFKASSFPWRTLTLWEILHLLCISNALVIVCISYFSCHWDQIPDEKELKGGGAYLSL